MKKKLLLFSVILITNFLILFGFQNKISKEEIKNLLKTDVILAIRRNLYLDRQDYVFDEKGFETSLIVAINASLEDYQFTSLKLLIAYQKTDDIPEVINLCLIFRKKLLENRIKYSYLIEL